MEDEISVSASSEHALPGINMPGHSTELHRQSD